MARARRRKIGRPSAAEEAENKRVLAAAIKQAAGGELSDSEIALLKRREKQRLDDSRRDALAACRQKELTDLFGVQRKTLREWQSEGMPRNSDRGRTYNLYLVLPWLRTRWERQAKATAAAPAANARWNESRARLAELNLKEVEGSLVRVDEIEAGRVGRILAVKRALLGLPKALAPQLAGMSSPRTITAALNAAVREIIGAFAGGHGKSKTKKPRRRS